ncbi:MAG: BTAD domain-containing putative transcriptional regulator [Candidatus Sericytochromatia bacterium]|nr:BTAD domain-containing putative transcriptional regulator [Candidatus Sericytochromatia bacterium]
MHDTILRGKITRPGLAPAHLARALWPEPGLPAATVLLAGPGHGKTQAMLSLAAQAERAGHPTAWVSFDELDADALGVFRHLVAAVREQVPPFGSETEALLGSPRLDPRVLWQVFFRELAAYNAQPGLLLFLDDVHHLLAGVPEVVRGLAFHLDKLPGCVHLVLSSRQRLGTSLERLEALGRLRLLGPGELRLSEAEAQRLWEASRPEPCPTDWPEVVRLYEGWPLGVAWAASRPPAAPAGPARGTGPLGMAFGATRPGGVGGPRVTNAQLLRYIAEELFGAQSVVLQQLMVRSALLLAVTPAAVSAACELPDPEAGLLALADAHLAEPLPDGAYRYPTYLRDFLVTEAKRRLPLDALRALHARAGEHFLAVGKPELAFPHLLEGQAWPLALQTLRAEAPTLLARGAQGQLQRWLAAFPEALQGAPWVQFFWGSLAWRAGEPARAGAHWAEALAGFRRDGEAAGETKALVRLYTMAVNQDDAAAGDRHGELVAALARAGADEDRADLLLAEALEADRRGDVAAWQAANEVVLAMPVGPRIELAQCACIAHMNLFTLALHQGELARARLHVDETQRLAGQWAFGPEGLFAGILRAHLQLLTDDVEAGGAVLRALPPSWEEALDWHDRASTLYILGGFHILQGDWRLADERLRRSQALFTQAGFPLGEKLPRERLAWLALQRGRPEDAVATVDGAGPLERGNVYDLALRLVRARALTLLGRTDEALEALGAIAQDARAMRAPLAEVRAALYEAAARMRAGDAAQGQAVLADAQATLERHGYEFLRRQDPALWQDLAAARAPVQGATAAAAPEGRLGLHLFGTFEVRLDDILLATWPRRKAKVVLAALALEPRGLPALTLAELIEDRTARQAGVQMCVMALRRVLEPELADGSLSRFVKLQQDRYTLVEEALATCDVREYARRVQAGLRARDAAPEEALTALEAALELYRGGLLEEPFFEPWFEAEREGFRRQAVAALAWLHDRHVYLGHEAEAQHCLERAAAIAPCDDDVVIQALRHHALRRAPERVRAAYWDHRKALHRRLDRTPSEDVEQAYREALRQAGG